jgi:hypothetical protein
MPTQLLTDRRDSNLQSGHDKLSSVEQATGESAREELKKLIGLIDGYPAPQDDTIKLIIYFDEAHPLTKATPGYENEKTRYDFLCSCLNEFLKFPMFAIFLSTNSSLSHFASPNALAKSARIRHGDAVTHAPITETPFDCHPNLMVEQGKLTVEDICTISFMAQFGRPL